MKMIPVKYYIGDDIYLECRDPEHQDIYPDSWAITKNGSCLNREAEWEHEPFPSGRDEEYLKRNRFSFDDAKHFLKHFLSGNIL
jgi:hypothetical protein